MSTSPLPDSLVLEILGYLLPPNPPLPQHLLAESLLHRITFLPPRPEDLDAWISPLPSTSAQPLSSRLHELAKEHVLHDTEYAHDGETVFARRKCSGHEDEVELHFALEGQDWKFHGVFLPSMSSHLDWSREIQSVDSRTLAPPHDGEESAADYWAGFSPPTQSIDLTKESNEAPEDDYWAQYSAAPSAHHSRPHSPAIPIKSRQTSSSSLARPAPSPRHSEHALLGAHNSLKALSPISKSKPLENGDSLHPRLIQKIKGSLRKAWLEFAGDGPESIEEKASAWLALARALRQRPVGAGHDERHTVTRARLDTLEEMYSLVEEHEDGFYRMVEDALRTHDQADVGRTYSSDQLGYWE